VSYRRKMAEDNILDLEDLARRYDTQVLREYLLESDMIGAGPRPNRVAPGEAGDDGGQQRPVWFEVFDIRPRCLQRIRLLLVLNFCAFWSVVAYCGYAYHVHVQESSRLKALPPLDVGLLGLFVLGSQSTLEFAIATCLTQPARNSNPMTSGFRMWDMMAWAVGGGARAAIVLDVQCLPLLWRGSSILFLLSSTVFAFSIGIFVFVVQLRLVLGLFCDGDHFSIDKPDLFFKGRDVNAEFGEVRVVARPPAGQEMEDLTELASLSRPPPVGTIKVANCAQLCDLSLVHAVLTRLYIPIGCQETQEFVLSITSFSRCFCEDVVQCSIKCFFLMDVEMNWLMLLSLFVSATQAVASCLYSSTSSMDIRLPDDDE